MPSTLSPLLLISDPRKPTILRQNVWHAHHRLRSTQSHPESELRRTSSLSDVPPVPQLPPSIKLGEGPAYDAPAGAIAESSSSAVNRPRSASCSNTPIPSASVHIVSTNSTRRMLQASSSPPPPQRSPPPPPKEDPYISSLALSPAFLNGSADVEADLALDTEIIELSSRLSSSDL